MDQFPHEYIVIEEPKGFEPVLYMAKFWSSARSKKLLSCTLYVNSFFRFCLYTTCSTYKRSIFI